MEGDLLKILQQAKEARLAATLTFTTSGGKIKAKLEVELEPTAPSPTGPTPSTATSPAPGGDRRQRRRRRHRGPAALAKSKARAKAHQASLALPFPPPPPPPPTSAQRLVKVIPRKTGFQPSFWQLDGEGDSEVDEEEERGGEREEDGRVHCIFCNVLSEPKLVEPISFDSMNYYIHTRSKPSIICTSCKIRGSDVGVCLRCQDIAYFNCNEWDRTCRPCMYALLAEEELSPNCSHSSNTAV